MTFTRFIVPGQGDVGVQVATLWAATPDADGDGVRLL